MVILIFTLAGGRQVLNFESIFCLATILIEYFSSIEDGYMTNFSRENFKLFQSPRKTTKGRFTESEMISLLKVDVICDRTLSNSISNYKVHLHSCNMY